MKNNNFYVYQLIDPRTNKPFYIGKGTGNRMYRHINEAHGCRDNWTNKIKCQIINSIENSGRTVIIEKIQENLSEDDAYNTEIALISQYGKIIDGTGILSNIADGGQGKSGHGKSVQSYTITGALIQSYKSLTEAANNIGIHKSTICAALQGRSTTAGGFWWGYNGEIPKLSNSKNITPVNQYDIHGNLIQSYRSINDAAKKVNTTYTSIVDCCRGARYRYTAAGFRWSYSGELPIQLPKNFKYKSKNRKLYSFDSQNNIVGIFDSINDAITHTDANATGISDCCHGRKQTSGGLRWTWID